MQFKKIWLPGLVLASVLWMVFSCRRETISPNPPSADSTALFAATIDGVSWKTDTVFAFLENEFGHHAKILTITGYTSKRIITVSMRDTSYTGSNDSTMAVRQYSVPQFGVGGLGDAAAFSYANNRIKVGMDSVWQQQGIGISGQASITASNGVSKKVSGTFSFKAKVIAVDSTGSGPSLVLDSVTVSAGTFKNIHYTFFRHP